MSDDRPTLIVSDLHLGKGPCTVRSLEPILARAAEIIVNGDVAELHLPGAEAPARAELEALHETCRRLGTRLRCLEGNHDLGVATERHALLAGGRVLVTHGDAFDPCVAPWSPWAGDARAAVARIMASFPPEQRDSVEATFAAARAAAQCEWADPVRARKHAGAWGLLLRPHAVLLILRYWQRYPRLAASFAARCAPAAQVVVCGHSHHPGRWRVGERVILNTGHFEFPGRPYAVRLQGDEVELLRIARRGATYQLVDGPRARLTLRAASATAAPSTPVSMPQASSIEQSSSVARLPRAPGA